MKTAHLDALDALASRWAEYVHANNITDINQMDTRTAGYNAGLHIAASQLADTIASLRAED
jgi:hypothetical protein